MPDQVPDDVMEDRYNRLVALVNSIAWEENQKQVGNEVEVLVADGEGKKDLDTLRVSGRAKDNRLVHVSLKIKKNGNSKISKLIYKII